MTDKTTGVGAPPVRPDDLPSFFRCTGISLGTVPGQVPSPLLAVWQNETGQCPQSDTKP
ncbi:MAG: hypothetical protein P1U53_13680 [Sulfitobacter sp.]|nr:hypothetical protein [Sulfitobacter sp.]